MSAPAPHSQPIVERLRREGADAFNQKYSLGMFKLCGEAADRIEELEGALRGLLCRHVGLVESGDCGFWPVENESEVIAARAALQKQEPGA